LKKAPGNASLGLDLRHGKESPVTVCAPSEKAGAYDMGGLTGVATEYDHKTGEIHVLPEDITHAEAERRFKP